MLIHTDKLRWLFWLRWKSLVRGFTRDKKRIVTAIFLLLFVVPLASLFAVGTFLAYRYLPAPANVVVLFLVLTAAYLMWIALPLLMFTVNEGLDISKLMLFPLTRAELTLSLLLSTLLDIPTLALLLLFVAVVAGWAYSVPVALLTLLAVLIFYVQIVGMSQLVLALLLRTLQSRRFRDLSIILIAIVSLLSAFSGQVVEPLIGLTKGVSPGTIQLLSYLQWSPPGMTARAIEQASLGNWGVSFAWLGLSLISCIAVLYLWQLVLARSLTAAEVGSTIRTSHHRVEAQHRGSHARPSWERIISPQVLAIATKELKYLWRDPQLKIYLFVPVIYVFIFILAPLLGTHSTDLSQWNVLFYPLIAFLSVFTLSYNALGMERQGLTTLFLFPIEPRRILWGKNLVVFAIGLVELVLIVLLGMFLLKAWYLLIPTLTIGLAGIAIVLGCSNFSSVFLPQYMPQKQGGFRATGFSSGNGCLRTILVFVIMGVTAVVLVPVVAVLVLPLFYHLQWVWTFAVPAALLYGAFFYWLVTRLVARRILNRVPEILAITTRE